MPSETKKPYITILVITYNRPGDMLELLKDLEKQHSLSEIVGEILVLNNASTEPYNKVTAYIKAHAEMGVQYFPHPRNLGVAGGRNYLIRKAHCPYLLALDDDVLFRDNQAIEKISKLLEAPHYQDNHTAVITLNIFYDANKRRQKSALPHKKYDTYKDKEWFLTYYFTGAAHLMKKVLFEETGLYPEDFFYGMEEYDLSYRVINAGYSLAYDSGVKVWHKESPEGRVPPKEKLAMMWKNKCTVAWRYLPKRFFYSTVLMWGFQFLRKSNFSFSLFLKTIRHIAAIPRNENRTPISEEAMKYLRSVQARLWY